MNFRWCAALGESAKLTRPPSTVAQSVALAFKALDYEQQPQSTYVRHDLVTRISEEKRLYGVASGPALLIAPTEALS